MASKKSKLIHQGPAQNLTNLLVERMEACADAQSLNDQVLIPFTAALETVCSARGYVLNIYGETANIVFSGDPDDAEIIYQQIESYLDRRLDNKS